MEGKDGRREGGSIHDTKIHLAVFLSFLAGCFHYMPFKIQVEIRPRLSFVLEITNFLCRRRFVDKFVRLH
jgi:hypothetical protein